MPISGKQEALQVSASAHGAEASHMSCLSPSTSFHVCVLKANLVAGHLQLEAPY